MIFDVYNVFYSFVSSDPAVQALQFLDVIGMKDPSQKAQFFRTTLTQVFPFIPRKLWFQHTWPLLEQEVCMNVFMVIWVVEFSSGGYKSRNVFA